MTVGLNETDLTPRRSIQRCRAALERRDHAADRLVEQRADDFL